MLSALRSRVRRAVLGKTDAKLGRQQRQLDAHAKELAGQRDLVNTQAARSKTLITRSKQTEQVIERAAVATRAVKADVDRLNTQLTELTRQVSELSKSAAALTVQDKLTRTAMTQRDVELERRRAQLGAVEVRLGRLEESTPASSGTLTGADAAAGDDLLTEIRRDHEQIRVRMQIISSYEERLRRVEDSLLDLHAGDERHRL